jgi:hypothetical protein
VRVIQDAGKILSCKLDDLRKAIQEGLESDTVKYFHPKKHLAALKKGKKNG